jgi:hypothetical protein
MRSVILATALGVLVAGTAEAKPDAQVYRFCGQEPNIDPAKTEPVKVVERLLSRVYSTRKTVFRSYRQEYDRNRQQIIKRNKRLPKSQQMPVPPTMTDAELKASTEFKTRSQRAHAGVQDEASAKQRIEAAKMTLARHQATYLSCKVKIEDRMRTAPTKSADELLKIPTRQRLAEEKQRLVQLAQMRKEELNAMRQEPALMAPILSAAVCAHQTLNKEIKREMRQVKKAARKSGEDATAKLEELTEAKQDHDLDIVELKRDMKRMKIRQQRCRGKQLKSLVECITAKIRTPNITPEKCKVGFGDELELLGYSESR